MKALPDKKEIPSLLTSISEAGKEAGLEFLLFQPISEINKDFYAEIPVSIKVAGNYHNVGLFFDNVSRLFRIVNIKDIVMTLQPTGLSRLKKRMRLTQRKRNKVTGSGLKSQCVTI